MYLRGSCQVGLLELLELESFLSSWAHTNTICVPCHLSPPPHTHTHTHILIGIILLSLPNSHPITPPPPRLVVSAPVTMMMTLMVGVRTRRTRTSQRSQTGVSLRRTHNSCAEEGGGLCHCYVCVRHACCWQTLPIHANMTC